MTEIEYLRKHPLDFIVGSDGKNARVRMFACPEPGECGEHPVLLLNEPADQADADADSIALVDVAAALGWILKMASVVLFESRGNSKEFEKSGIEIAGAVVRYHNEMTAAIERLRLN